MFAHNFHMDHHHVTRCLKCGLFRDKKAAPTSCRVKRAQRALRGFRVPGVSRSPGVVRGFDTIGVGFPWANELARNIHIARHDNRLSKTKIAETLGVSRRTVTRVLA